MNDIDLSGHGGGLTQAGSLGDRFPVTSVLRVQAADSVTQSGGEHRDRHDFNTPKLGVAMTFTPLPAAGRVANHLAVWHWQARIAAAV